MTETTIPTLPCRTSLLDSVIAFCTALGFADSKQDLPGAAKIIDRVLGLTDEQPTPVQRLRLLVPRTGEAQRAAGLLEEAAAVPLDAAERASAKDAPARPAELRG
ncbi:hypothetical protein AB0935_18855 [Streptomyces sp. NPDC007027]|uniref:hypothetical protein n=1 Tax=unclassified Streptomyces TaxID=2593676 RepID=UPI0033C149FB